MMAGAYAVPIVIGMPVAILGLLSSVSPTAALLFKRCMDLARAITHMLLTSEGNFKKDLNKLPDPDLLTKATGNIQKVNLILIRHGESEWNGIFNKGSGAQRFLMMPFRFVAALFKEVFVSFSGGSLFLDSPLNDDGEAQAKGLQKFIEGEGSTNAHVDIMAGKGGKSIVVTSNLRRCIETVMVGLWPRFQKSEEQIIVLSDLQEASANVDTFSLSSPMGLPPLKTLPTLLGCPEDKVTSKLQMTGNAGQKLLFESGLVRLQRFAAWCFDSPNTKAGDATIIVSGHSLFFRTLFLAYMPRGVQHEAKKLKIVNAGAVAITLERGIMDGVTVYRIDPASVKVVYGGFGK